MLDEHATGWGLKREDDDIVLIWKGHNDVFVWKSAANMCRTPVDEQLSSGDGSVATADLEDNHGCEEDDEEETEQDVLSTEPRWESSPAKEKEGARRERE
nr:hypothetical protein D5086_0000052040 [Ipomoea trifida]